jgi:hypothetical protein
MSERFPWSVIKPRLVPAVRYLRAVRDGSSLLGLALHRLKAMRGDDSFAGEYRYLRAVLARLQIDRGFVADIAACDGVSQSCTLGFFRDPRWRGLAVEMDPVRFARLAYLYARFPNARLARARVTPGNVASLLHAFEAPAGFELLNLDIDSYDLYVIDAMLEAGFRPKVVSMEVNERIPPPLYFTVDFREDHRWQGDHFMGCSLTAAADTVKPYGYVLESLQYNNAVFVRADLAAGRFEDLSARQAYDEGYRNRPDRKALFYWNADMECLLEYEPEQAIGFLREYFRRYEGRYTLR